MRKAKTLLLRVCYIARESASVTFILAETQRQAEEQAGFSVEKKEDLRFL